MRVNYDVAFIWRWKILCDFSRPFLDSFTHGSAITPLTLINDLRGHILKCSRKSLSGGTQPSQSLRRAEVRYLHDTAVRVNKHVVAFYIAVDDLLIVEVFQS